MRYDRRREDGAVAILTAVVSLVLFVVAALVVDLGLARDTRRDAQNAADAASLAAANVLYGDGITPQFTKAVKAAKDYAKLNFDVQDGEWAGCADSGALRHRSTESACISFQNAGDTTLDQTRPNTVRVRIPVRAVPTGLGALAGVSSVPVASEAEAGLEFTTAPGCALCVLGTGEHKLQNGDVHIEGGEVHLNGSVSAATNGSLTSDKRIRVQGTATGGTFTPAPTTGQPVVADPLAFMPMPGYSGSQLANPCTQGPGRYGSFTFPNATCTLAPGTYVVAGSSTVWNANGAAKVTGTGVTLYFTCGTPAVPASCAANATGATLDLTGSSAVTIQAPATGPLQGLAIVYDRNNNAVMKLAGNASNNITGTIYAPSATLEMNGNGCMTTMQSMIVIKDLVMKGDPSCLTSRYSRSDNVLLPPQGLHLSR